MCSETGHNGEVNILAGLTGMTCLTIIHVLEVGTGLAGRGKAVAAALLY